MADETSTAKPTIDRKLVALLTGELGDSQKIGKVSADLGQAFSVLLSAMIKDESGLEFGFSYAGASSGMKNVLIADLDEYTVLVDGSLKGWCPDFTIACPCPVLIAMVESLLGNGGDIIEPEARQASKIELKMSPMLFDRIATLMRMSVDVAPNVEPVLTKPYNSADRPEPDEDTPDVFATEIKMAMSYGPIVTQFSVIIPQKTLLKTKVKPPKLRGAAKSAPTPEFTEQIAGQIRRSDVKLEARIKLQQLTLGTLSRLQAGDIIPFFDISDVKVDVAANGKELYVAEFGRAGDQYTVRVKDTHGSETDLLQHLLG